MGRYSLARGGQIPALDLPDNGCIVEERHKPAMVTGKAMADNCARCEEEPCRFQGQCRLISPHFNARWGKLAAEFLEAKKTLKPARNLHQPGSGEPYWRARR